MQQFHTAIRVFNNGRTAIDPVATVDVGHAFDILDGGAVDVAADHAIQPSITHGVHNGIFKIENEGNCALDTALGVAGERPVVGNAESAPQPGNPHIRAHQ